MSRYIPADLRRLVSERANCLCEYCLSFEGYSAVKFQIEHIVSIKHGGLTVSENLALACIFCNLSKGTDVGTFLYGQHIVRLFNPRTDLWKEHFEFFGVQILPLTEIGEATVKILQLNDVERLTERQELSTYGLYPHPNAGSLLL
jgi:HNH endonuclease